MYDFKLGKLPTEIPMWAFPSIPGQWGACCALVKMEVVPQEGGILAYFSSSDTNIQTSLTVAASGQVCTAMKSIGQFGFISLLIDT